MLVQTEHRHTDSVSLFNIVVDRVIDYPLPSFFAGTRFMTRESDLSKPVFPDQIWVIIAGHKL